MTTSRISINPPKIPDGADYDHKSTSWQVSKTPYFRDEDILVESLKDEDNKIEFRFSVNLDYYKTVYTRAKIHLSDDRESEWTRPTTVTKNQEGFKYSNNIVLTPLVDVEVDVELTDSSVKINASKFYMFAGVGKHDRTDWIIEDLNGNVIFERKDDKKNLYSIEVDKLKLEENKFYVIKVAYKTDTLATSNYGKVIINTTDLKKKPISLKVNRVFENDVIICDIEPESDEIRSFDILIETKAGEPIIYNRAISILTGGFKVSTRYFEDFDNDCLVKIRLRYKNDELSLFKSFYIKTLRNGGLTERDNDIEYAEKITEIGSLEGYFEETADIHTLELKNGIIPFYPKNSITPVALTFDYKNQQLIRRDEILDLRLNADMNSVEQVTSITELNNGNILISYYLKNSEETLYDLFKYSHKNDKFTHVKTFEIKDAKKGSRGMNQMLPLDDFRVVLTVWDEEDNSGVAKNVYILDTVTETLEVLVKAHGERVKQIGLMTYDGKLVVYGGIYKNEDDEWVQDEVVYSYDLDTKEWREVTYLNTDDKTFEITGIRLKSGDYLMYANYYKESTKHTDKRFWAFRNDSERIDVIDDLELPSYVYDNLNDNDRKLLNFSVLLSNGNALINYVEKEPNTNKIRSFMFS